MNPGTFRWNSLRVRLVVTALLIQVIMLAVLAWNNQRITNTAMIDQTERHLQALVPILNAGLTGHILREDIATLTEFVQKVVKHHSLNYLEIADANGEVLARSGMAPAGISWSGSIDFKQQAMAHGLNRPYAFQFPVAVAGRRIGTMSLIANTRNLRQAQVALLIQSSTITILAAFIIILLLGLFSYLLTRQLTRLTEAAERMKNGDLSVQIPIVSSDEIGDTANAFNEMARQISFEQGKLQQKNQRIRLLMDSTTGGICGIDRSGCCRFANKSCIRQLGYKDEAQLTGKNILSYIHHPQPEQDVELVTDVGNGEFSHSDKATLCLPDQPEIPIEYWCRPLYEQEELAGAVLTFIDISERRHAEESLRKSELNLRTSQERFDLAVQGSSDGIWDWNLVTNELYLSARFKELLGYTDADFENTWDAWDVLIHPEDSMAVNKALRMHLSERMPYHVEYRMRRRTGDYHWVLVRGQAIWDQDGKAIRMAGSLTDIGSRKESEVRIERLAYFDELTGLPNRRYFLDRLAQELALVNQHGNQGALLFIDLDHFKRINDSLGHHVGDFVLQQVAQRMVDNLYTDDTVARLGGDEFVVLLPQLHDDLETATDRANQVANWLRKALGEPCTLKGHSYHITPSIGVVMYPQSGDTAEELLKCADTALYRSKETGRNRISFYHPDMKEAADTRLRLEKDLHNALERNELSLVFQPQVDLHGNILGAEALLRWQHPQQGPVSPVEFIPVAEDTGLIHPIGEWVMQQVIAHVDRWLAGSLLPDHAVVSLNISPRQFQESGFVDQVSAILARSEEASRHLKFEITEGTAISDIQDTIGKIMALKPLGVGFSIDDFGKGYSSLTYIKQLPIEQLKIDRSFVRDICADSDDMVIVKTIISMAHHLNLNVIAEGVETQEQIDLLVQHGCEAFQGYYFSHPLPVDEFERLLQEKAGTGHVRAVSS